ncbi:MAG: hypothetical protein ACOC0O_03710, partial [Spirochaetota bacterium]
MPVPEAALLEERALYPADEVLHAALRPRSVRPAQLHRLRPVEHRKNCELSLSLHMEPPQFDLSLRLVKNRLAICNGHPASRAAIMSWSPNICTVGDSSDDSRQVYAGEWIT